MCVCVWRGGGGGGLREKNARTEFNFRRCISIKASTNTPLDFDDLFFFVVVAVVCF